MTDRPILPRAELVDRAWRYSRSNGETLVEHMRFAADGTVEAPGAQERRWRLEEGTLVLVDDTGRTTARFDRLVWTRGGHKRLCGRYAGHPALVLYHFLDPATSRTPAHESRLNVSMSLCGEADILLVTVNSAARFSEGRETRWEFYGLADRLGLDHVRIAEMRAPTVYYLDKIRHTASWLAAVVRGRYRLVILAGMSSGGFAAIALAELLGAQCSSTEFAIFVINPQTAHATRNRAFIARHVDPSLAPELLSDHAVGMSDLAVPNLYDLVGESGTSRGRVSHRIFYDADNIAEAYYVSLIADLPNFELTPLSIGKSHMDSTVQIFEENIVQEAIEALVAKSRPSPSGY